MFCSVGLLRRKLQLLHPMGGVKAVRVTGGRDAAAVLAVAPVAVAASASTSAAISGPLVRCIVRSSGVGFCWLKKIHPREQWPRHRGVHLTRAFGQQIRPMTALIREVSAHLLDCLPRTGLASACR